MMQFSILSLLLLGKISLDNLFFRAEPFYTTSNNTARKETIEEAAALDFKLISSWVGHKHLKIFDNSTDFQGKVERVW
jgi:hypothetical protein